MILESNLAKVVCIIKSNVNENHPQVNMIRMIKELLKENWQLHISHFLREGNEATNHCTLIGLDKDLGFHVILDMQLELEAILYMDLMGGEVLEVTGFNFVPLLTKKKEKNTNLKSLLNLQKVSQY